MSTNFNENYWEKHYRRSGERHAHLTPSPHFLSEVAGLVPGTALDAGCGEGADAIWLAQNGWRVTAVDTSKNALDKAKSSAREAGVDIDWRYADLRPWTPPENSFDLVTSQYVHTTNDHEFYKKLANAVKTGGRLLIVGHQPPASHETSPHAEGSHVTAEHLATSLDADQWEIEVAEPRSSERIAPNGRTYTLRDSVLRAHKR